METTKKPPRRRSSIYTSKPKTPSSKAGNFSTRFSLKTFVKRVDKLTESQKDAINRSGFGNVLLIGNHMLSKNLLVEIMERWHPRKQGFVLAKGEFIRITRLDVAVILGLRAIGQPVNVVSRLDLPFIELEREFGAALWNRKISVGLIEERLEALGDNDDDHFVRSFLLFTFGTILFPNSSGKLDSRYLYLLQDVDSVGTFDWGSAVLEDLVFWLGKRKENNVEYVGGCLIFLQIWSYEHIDIARPSLNNHITKFPRACRWDNSKARQRSWFISQFRTLQSNQMSWNLDLTSEELELEIVKELLVLQREMVITDIDVDSQEDGKLADEERSNQLRTSPDISTTSIGNQLSSHNLHFSVINVDVSNNQGNGVSANKACFDQLKTSSDLAVTLLRDQHSSQPVCCKLQEKQYPNFIATDVSDNQGDSVLANEKQNLNFISMSSNDRCNNQGDGVLPNNDCSNQLLPIFDLASTSSGGQCPSPSTSCCPQLMQKHNIIDISSSEVKQNLNFISMSSNDRCNNQGDGVVPNNDCSNQLLPIFDLASTSSGDQCPSPSTSCCPQLMQKHNIIDISSSEDNEDKSTLEDCVMEQEISQLRSENNDLKKEIEEKERKLSEAIKIEEENTKLRKEVETLKHQNQLHLSAFNIVNRLNGVVFSKIADEILGITK